MTTIALELDEPLASQFSRACREEGHGEGEVATALLRRYLNVAQLRQGLTEHRLAALYESLAAEDVALAEAGMADFQNGLRGNDEP